MSRVQPARAYDALYGAWGTRATPSRPTRATPRAPRGRFDRPSLTSSSTQRRIFADPVYTVSGARDHYREQARATNATETVPVRENMFAEGANYPAHETRCVRAPSPERPLPSIAAPAANSLSRPYLAHENEKQKTASRRRPPLCPRSSSRRHRMRTRDSLAPGARLARSDRRPPPGAPGRSRRGDRRLDCSRPAERGRGTTRLRPRRGPGPLAVPAARRTAPRGAPVDRPAHAPRARGAAPYPGRHTVMARAVPRRRIAPPASRAAGGHAIRLPRVGGADGAVRARGVSPDAPSTRQRALNALHNVPGTNGEPGGLTLRDPNYDAGAPLGAAGVDRVRARAREAFGGASRRCRTPRPYPAAPADGGVEEAEWARARARDRARTRGTARGFESRHRRARGGG